MSSRCWDDSVWKIHHFVPKRIDHLQKSHSRVCRFVQKKVHSVIFQATLHFSSHVFTSLPTCSFIFLYSIRSNSIARKFTPGILKLIFWLLTYVFVWLTCKKRSLSMATHLIWLLYFRPCTDVYTLNRIVPFNHIYVYINHIMLRYIKEQFSWEHHVIWNGATNQPTN